MGAPRLRPPQSSSGLVRPSYSTGLRPPTSVQRGRGGQGGTAPQGQQRKLSGIARPMPVSKGGAGRNRRNIRCGKMNQEKEQELDKG